MRHPVQSSWVQVLLTAIAVPLYGCAAPRPAQHFESRDVQQVRAYDWETQTESPGRLVRTIEAGDEVDQIVALLGRYEEGWVPVHMTVPAGSLVLEYVGRESSATDNWPMTQFRISPGSIVTYIDGKPYSREMSGKDQERLCRILGLEESFFSEPATASKGRDESDRRTAQEVGRR
jgi:hypothetical protein